MDTVSHRGKRCHCWRCAWSSEENERARDDLSSSSETERGFFSGWLGEGPNLHPHLHPNPNPNSIPIPIPIPYLTLKRDYRTALDIGASPGGWSFYICQEQHALRVISVDKGDITIKQPWPSQLRHWRLTGEDAIRKLASREQVEHHNSIDLFCCDANICPEASSKLLVLCSTHGLLAAQGRFVLTFKNIYRKKETWDQSVISCLEMLRNARFSSLQLFHLLANTPKEITVVGEWTNNR